MLAHVNRLACLKVLFEHPSSSVGEVAGSLRVPVNQASMFLRALQARGLIRAQRNSRWVRYVPSPDPLVPESKPILNALRRALINEKRSGAYVRHTLTGFTHLRRLVILICLHEKRAVSAEELARFTRISLPALSRHLNKLAARQLVRYEKQEWRLIPPPNDLSKTLLHLTQSDGQESMKEKVSQRKTCKSVSAEVSKEQKAAFDQPLDPIRKRKG